MFYLHLKVFGCRTFAHVPKERRTKLDDKSALCIFIGYGDEEFGYRLEKEKSELLITIPPTSNHSPSAKSITNEVAQTGEQPDEIVEQGEQLGNHTEKVEYTTQEEELS